MRSIPAYLSDSSGPITILGNTVYNVANKFHLIPTGGNDAEAGGYTQVPGGARAEAERRRLVSPVHGMQRISHIFFPARWL